MKLLHPVRRKEDLVLLKRCAILVAQYAAAVLRRRQHAVVRAEQEKRSHRVAVVSRHFAKVHRVERHRDRPHTVLCENQTHQACKFLGVEGRVSQNFHKLVEHAAKNAPQLCRFLCPLGIARGKKLLGLRLQGLRQVHLFQVVVQRAHFFLRRAAAAHALFQAQKCSLHACAQRIDRFEPGSRLVRPVRTVAVRMRRPRRFPRPHRAAQLPLERIVFKKIALFHAKSGKAGLETAEHILILKAAACSVERAEQQRQHGAFQNVAAVGIIERNAVAGKYALDRPRVGIKAARRNGDLAVAVASLARKLQDLRRDPFALAVGGARLVERDRIGRLVIFVRRTEKAALDVIERAMHLGRRQDLFLAGNTHIARERIQPLPHTQAFGKKLALLRIAQQRDRHAVRAPQQKAQNVQLPPRKIGKSVEENILPVDISRRLQIFLQFFEKVARITTRRVELAEINAVDQRKVAQLIAALPFDLLHALRKLLGRNSVSLQFLHHGEQTLQECRALRRPLIDPERRCKLCEGTLKRQELASIVERHVRAAAADAQHTRSKQLECQGLGMARGGIAANPAKIHFRYMRSMLRHEQNLLRGIPQRGDPLQHTPGFTRARASHQYVQQATFPLLFRQHF